MIRTIDLAINDLIVGALQRTFSKPSLAVQFVDQLRVEKMWQAFGKVYGETPSDLCSIMVGKVVIDIGIGS